MINKLLLISCCIYELSCIRVPVEEENKLNEIENIRMMGLVDSSTPAEEVTTTETRAEDDKYRESEDAKPKFYCPTCEISFATNCNLRRHNQKRHNIQTVWPTRSAEHVITTRTFHSVDDFTEWKHKVEKETISWFVSRRGTKIRADGTEVKHYECHRSGFFKAKGTGKRAMKRAGSNRIGGKCGAFIRTETVFVDDAYEINVTYQSRHNGHDAEVGRLCLLKPEKKAIAEQLRQGVPMDTVLKNISEQFDPLKRLSFTSRKDLHNIAASYAIRISKDLDKLSDAQQQQQCLSSSNVDSGEEPDVMVNRNDVEEVTVYEFDAVADELHVEPIDERKAEVEAVLDELRVELANCTTHEEFEVFLHCLNVLKAELVAVREKEDGSLPAILEISADKIVEAQQHLETVNEKPDESATLTDGNFELTNSVQTILVAWPVVD